MHNATVEFILDRNASSVIEDTQDSLSDSDSGYDFGTLHMTLGQCVRFWDSVCDNSPVQCRDRDSTEPRPLY